MPTTRTIHAITVAILAASLQHATTNAQETVQCGNTTTWCPSAQSCCEAQYSPTGYGCQSSARGSKSLEKDTRHLKPPRGTIPTSRNSGICCKPGPQLPPSTTLPNCLILGDSVSIGYTPTVQTMLSATCQVQHAPWDVRDGGAGSTTEGLACLDNFLRTQNQTAAVWDVILFNFGLHNLNDTTPQAQTIYRQELMEITQGLLHHNNNNNNKGHHMPKLIYATTTPFMPLANKGIHVVDQLNEIGLNVMQKMQQTSGQRIHILDMNSLVHRHCGNIYTECDWCNASPCSYHYNKAGKAAQGVFAAGAIQEALSSSLKSVF